MLLTLVRRLIPLALVALVLGSLGSAVTASNTVPATKAGRAIDTITLNKISPAACKALGVTFTALVKGGPGNINGTSANELLLGSAGNDDFDAKGGTDCCLYGGGVNTNSGNRCEVFQQS